MGEKTDRNPKEWTLMFYFASDNPLAPNVVSQLKALKSAGYHLGVNVVLQFDPNVEDIPTHIFDVNKMNKIEHAFEFGQQRKKALEKEQQPDEERPFKFWGRNDPFIRNLVLDKLWNDTEKELKLREKVLEYVDHKYPGTDVDAELPIPGSIRAKAPVNGANLNPEAEPAPLTSLGDFLDFCIEKYPAKHYMLFLLGHGLVVGNDMFMFDQNAASDFLTLRDFGALLTKFQDKNLELVAFHSCGLSGLEIACELKGSAKYMIASQGEEFVGSWPYREILIRIFNDLIDKNKSSDEEAAIKETIKKIFSYVLKSSHDFQLAGYSFDLCLCDLRGIDFVTSKLAELSRLLTHALKLASQDPRDIVGMFIKERILLAHWKAQSFWGESYTDLYDFCYCLNELCQAELAPDAAQEVRKKIAVACGLLIAALKPEDEADSELRKANQFWPVINAEFAGPEYQYAHGFSVYFPWAKPRNKGFWDGQYPNYKFNSSENFDSGWANFLSAYWEATIRTPIGDERPATSSDKEPPIEQVLLEKITSGFQDSSLFLGLCPDAKPNRKPIGSSGLGSGDPKPIGSSGLGSGDPKPLGSSGLGSAHASLKLKPIGGSGLGPASGKPIGMAGLGSGDGKPFGSAGTGGCDCASIKNYPLSTFPTSPGFYRVIKRGHKPK